jgi:hypothetical protein
MMIEGTWNVTISTPIGAQHVVLRVRERAGAIEGTATQGAETVPMLDAVLEGARFRWSQRVTKPLKLDLRFEVQLDGDRMTGTAKAGIFPASKLEGTRAPPAVGAG